jgi:hypothetical protein
MYDGPVAVSSMSSKVQGPKQLNELRVRRLDDGSFTLRAEYCGKGKDGMMSWESKESSYKNVAELTDSIKNLLKPNIASREKSSTKNLASRAESDDTDNDGD